MILTTTHQIEGQNIKAYKGVVAAEVIIGANFVRDFFAGLRDFFGGRSGSYESVLREGKEKATAELMEKAHALGANAVVGIDLAYQAVGASGSMLMVVMSGTAVVAE